MSIWIIEPRDPLIVRDGRPFGPNPGARAKSLPFPFPSTTTGGIRTKAGLENGVFDKNKIAEVRNIAVRGPVLVELDKMGQIANWLNANEPQWTLRWKLWLFLFLLVNGRRPAICKEGFALCRLVTLIRTAN